MSVNRVVLIGRLTRDPELRTTSTDKHVVSFSVAVDKRFKPTDDSPAADFFRVSAWGKTAEFVASYLAKGRLVAIDGRLQQRKYTAQDGSEKETVEIVAESVQGLDRPREDGGTSPRPAQAPAVTEFDPFAEE